MKIVLHAPTGNALQRSRSNLRNMLEAAPETELCIVANADGVAAALDHPDSETDRYLRLCGDTLRNRSLTPPPGIETVPAAVLELACLQADGWIYIRA